MVQGAIDSIANGPAGITFTNAQGDTKTVPLLFYAQVLQAQLDEGRMEAETLANASGVQHLSDGRATNKDEMNIDSQLIAWALADSPLVYLMETMIHEGTHKWQSTSVMTADEEEIEALGAELAIKDSFHLSPDNWFYRFKANLLIAHVRNYEGEEFLRRPYDLDRAINYRCFIEFDTAGTDTDCFASNATDWYQYPLFPTRASDMMIFENYFLLPPEHCLALICGGEALLGVARILALDIYQGQVMGQYSIQDFGPPLHPPMFFYSMTRSTETGLEFYYVLDTLNRQILTMADLNADLIPDEIAGIYASALWPGFEPLMNLRGVEAVIHPHMGFGLIGYEEWMREADVFDPYDMSFFLPDADGDNVADACIPADRFEFLVFSPSIQVPLPWAGDTVVSLFATWDHDIAVWATDSLGQILFEELGMTHMFSGVDGECMLSRPLLAEEFVLPIDMQTGERLRLATKVINPIPQEVTIVLEAPGMLHLRWEAVPGAEYYAIYKALEPFEFPPEPSFFTETNEIVLPLADEVKFYRVTAVR